MSTTYDYFFNSELPLSALTEAINRAVGCSLAPWEGNAEDLYCRFLSMELSLGRHNLVNDGSLNFEDFAYQLSLRIAGRDIDLTDMSVPAMALIAYALHRSLGIVGLLVYDVQIELARYVSNIDPESGEPWMEDVQSNECVVFPEHFEVLNRRLRRS